MNKTEVEQQIAREIEEGDYLLDQSSQPQYGTDSRKIAAAQAAARFAKATALSQQFLVSQAPSIVPVALDKPAATESLSDSLLGPR